MTFATARAIPFQLEERLGTFPGAERVQFAKHSDTLR